jgi:hypothetical protein
MIFAAGMPPVSVRLVGNTFNALGAAPKLHCNVAPLHTCGQPITFSKPVPDGGEA